MSFMRDSYARLHHIWDKEHEYENIKTIDDLEKERAEDVKDFCASCVFLYNNFLRSAHEYKCITSISKMEHKL